METCGVCLNNQNGKCIQSGWYGCSDGDLLDVNETDEACNSFEEKE